MDLTGKISDFKHYAIEEQIGVVVAQRLAMELLHGVVELAGDVGDGLRGGGFTEHRFQHLADLASGDAAQKSQQNQVVDGLLAALVARQQLRAGSLSGTWDTNSG